MEPGDAVAFVLPNGVEIVELYLAALQAGWFIVPINHHLVGPEIAYIVNDCEAKVFIGHERFAEACNVAAARSGISRGASSRGRRHRGFRAPSRRLVSAQSTDCPKVAPSATS